MFVLRWTKKRLARIGRSTIGPEGVSSTTRMGDHAFWNASMFAISSLALATPTRLSTR